MAEKLNVPAEGRPWGSAPIPSWPVGRSCEIRPPSQGISADPSPARRALVSDQATLRGISADPSPPVARSRQISLGSRPLDQEYEVRNKREDYEGHRQTRRRSRAGEIFRIFSDGSGMIAGRMPAQHGRKPAGQPSGASAGSRGGDPSPARSTNRRVKQ
jgi:hypothetical protein